MKKTEKKLKQKIASDLENSIQNYNIKYYLNTDNKKDKRVSKNQYKLLKSNLVDTDIGIKFPFIITVKKDRHNLNINKEKNFITPSSFHSTNKGFSFDSLTLNENLTTLQNSIVLFCTIVNTYKHTSEKY